MPSACVWALSLALACLFTAFPAGARSQPLDGAWTVDVRTHRGACDPWYRYPVVLSRGQVRFRNMFGESSAQVVGLIRPGGRIAAQFGQGQDRVRVVGRLRATAGNGTWSAPGRGCSGRWVAERRG
jgi:hypothetical protein